ncbi:pilin, partial [Patescibacteria group bacterium]|nr:pilin [Patescibacteria group bacterium]
GLKNPLNNICTLPQFLNAILDAVVQLGTIVLILALVYVGFQFVAAQGNEEKIRSARSALMWTVIGGLVLLGAKAIGLVIEGTVSAL